MKYTLTLLAALAFALSITTVYELHELNVKKAKLLEQSKGQEDKVLMRQYQCQSMEVLVYKDHVVQKQTVIVDMPKEDQNKEQQEQQNQDDGGTEQSFIPMQ